MQVVKEPVTACEVSLQIEVEPEKVSAAVNQAYREFARFVAVPGFRKGKAPMSFVKPRVPESQLRERTAELLVAPAYQEALQQENVQQFASPKLELLELVTEPPNQKFQFKAIVPLPPQITLGEYAGIPVERRRVELRDEEVEQRLQAMRERAAEYPIVEGRKAKTGDMLVTSLTITPEGAEQGEARPTVIQIGDADNIPGLDDQLVGLKPGDEKIFSLTYPEDYPNDEVAGHSAQFHVKVNELHERKVPDLDDEFAKKAGVENVAALRLAVRTDLEKYYLETAERQMEADLVDKVVANSQVEYPGVLREAEVDEDVREFLAGLERRNVTLDDFLTQSGQTRESLTQDFETRADRRIRRGLVLGEIARTENLLVTDEDVEREIAERAEAQRATPAAMKAYIEANKQTEAVRNTAQMKKVLGFLTAAAIITDKVVRPGEEEGGPGKKAKSSPSKAKQKSAAPAEEKPRSAQARKIKPETGKPAKASK
jgi:trigger factor